MAKTLVGVKCTACGVTLEGMSVFNRSKDWKCPYCGEWNDIEVTLSKDNISPSHYADMRIPPNVYITENKLEWEVGNVIKYVSRYNNKNGIEDLRKAKKYLELLCKRVYGKDL